MLQIPTTSVLGLISTPIVIYVTRWYDIGHAPIFGNNIRIAITLSYCSTVPIPCLRTPPRAVILQTWFLSLSLQKNTNHDYQTDPLSFFLSVQVPRVIQILGIDLLAERVEMVVSVFDSIIASCFWLIFSSALAFQRLPNGSKWLYQCSIQ